MTDIDSPLASSNAPLPPPPRPSCLSEPGPFYSTAQSPSRASKAGQKEQTPAEQGISGSHPSLHILPNRISWGSKWGHNSGCFLIFPRAIAPLPRGGSGFLLWKAVLLKCHGLSPKQQNYFSPLRRQWEHSFPVAVCGLYTTDVHRDRYTLTFHRTSEEHMYEEFRKTERDTKASSGSSHTWPFTAGQSLSPSGPSS